MGMAEDLLLTIIGNDQASKVFKNIDSNVQSMASNAQQSLNSLNTGLLQLSSASSTFLGSLSGGKSAGELIFGTSSKAETNEALLTMMSDTDTAAKQLRDHVDHVTDSSLVSMQNLIPALNAFKTATGATDEEINNATQGIADFGAKVLAQTGSTDLAEQAMMDLSKGIKGACASLDQYGITTDALKRTGLWSGEEDDIEGYIAAVQELTGDTSELMKTNEGVDQLLGKAFSRAGKQIGNELLPGIKDLKLGLLDLNNATGGNLFAGLLVGAEALELTSTYGQQLTNTVNGVKAVAEGIKGMGDIAKTAGSKIKELSEATKALDTVDTVNDLGGLDVNELRAAAQHADMGGGSGLDDAIAEELWDMDTGTIQDAEVNRKKSYDDIITDIAEDNEQILKGLEDGMDVDVNTKNLKGTSDAVEEVVDEATGIAEAGAGLGVAGAEAEVAAAETATFSSAFAGFGAGLGAMVAPMMMVAAAVAIMVPIVAGLVVEILVFVKLIMEVMSALNFDSVDLSGAINGLKQFGTAMWELTSAVAAITVTTLLSVIMQAVTFLSGGVVNAISNLVTQIKQIVPVVNSITSAGSIGEGVPAFLTNFADVMNNINSAVESMLGLSWSVLVGNLMFLGGYLGNFQTAISSAIEDIKGASAKIQELSNMDAITDDSGINEKLAQTADTLGKVADAISSLSTVNDKVNNWNPFTNFMKALDSAKSDIQNAAAKLKDWDVSGLDVGDKVGPAITHVADALKPVVQAINSLSNINDAVSNWNPLTNFQKTFDSAKADIEHAAATLKNWDTNNLDVGEDVGPAITRLADALKPVKAAIEGLSAISGLEYESDTSLATAIQQAKSDIQTAANEISSLKDIPEVEEGTATKIIRVADAAKVVKRAIDSFIDNPIPAISDNGTGTNVSKAREVISKVADEISKLIDIPDIPAGTATKVINTANALGPVKSSIGVINTTIIPEFTNTTLWANLRDAVAKIKTVANILQGFIGMPTVPEGLASSVIQIADGVKPVKQSITVLNTMEIPTWSNTEMLVNLRDAIEKIKTVCNILNQLTGVTPPTSASGIFTSINTSLNQLKTVISTMSFGFTIPDTTIIQAAVTAVKNVITQLNTLASTGLADVGGLLASVTNSSNMLKATLVAMAGGFYASGVAIGSSIVNGVRAGLSPLGGIVVSSVSSAISSASGTAHSGGAHLGSEVTNGFKSNLKLADAMKTEMTYVKQAVDNGISAAVTAAQNGAQDVVAAFKAGIETGSPGAMAWATYDEMNYIKDFIISEGKYVVQQAKNLGEKIVEAFGNPSLETGFEDFNNIKFTKSNMGSLETMISNAPDKQSQQPVILNIHEGAVQLDARNLTTKESKQVMINALEGLDIVRNIDIRGIS